jgi:hypothetical protein
MKTMNANGPDDSSYTFNICNGFFNVLSKRGHNIKFYHGGDDCWESHLRDESLNLAGGSAGGSDYKWADDVDLFFICTHGYNQSGTPVLDYNTKKDDFNGYGTKWRLGNGRRHHGLTTLMLCACDTTELKYPNECWDIFQGLNEICCSYGGIYDYFGTEEIGRDVAQNLIDGHTIADAWLDGVSDGWLDNHPIVIGANDERSYDKNGHLIKILSTLNLDCLQPHGYSVTLRGKVGLQRIWMEKTPSL